ncbi:MAG TPA: hypothetical protein VF624_05135 [Tepidisphaeraceae bacterium]
MPSAPAASTFYVGNSLTIDASPTRIDALNDTIGTGGAFDWHIKCGSGLDSIYTTPEEVCLGSMYGYGKWNQALPNNEWDRVSLEPFYDSLDATTGAPARVRQFIAASQSAGKNAKTDYFIYSAWPSTAGIDYADTWTKPYDANDINTMMTRDSTRQIMASLRSEPALAGRTFLVPVGEVYFALDAKMRRGEIPGFSSAADLYRDAFHANAAGSYAAALTMYATMNRVSPVGMALPAAYGDSGLSEQTRLIFQQTVWDVVRTSEFTGVPEPTLLSAAGVLGAVLLRRVRRVA